MRRRGGGREPGHRAPPAPCRGQANRVLGHHTALLAMIKGLPLTYNKDLQEDKEPLFDAMNTMHGSVQIAGGVLAVSYTHLRAHET